LQHLWRKHPQIHTASNTGQSSINQKFRTVHLRYLRQLAQKKT
jgi:hypothetical protein